MVEPPRLEYKGFKYKYSIKGDIIKSIILRTKRDKANSSGMRSFALDNSVVFTRKGLVPQSKFVKGPTFRLCKRKKLLSLVSCAI